MPIIVPKSGVWTRQPYGAVELARNNPLAAGVRLAAYPVSGVLYDAAQRTLATKNGAVQVTTNSVGRAATSYDATTWWEFPDRDAYDVTGALTLVYFGGIRNNGPLLLKGAQSSGALPFGVEVTGGVGIGFQRGGATDYQNFGFTAGASVAKDKTFLAITQDGVLGAGATARAFIDGTFYVTSGGGMADSVATANSSPVRLGKSDTDWMGLDANLIAIFGRVVTDREMNSFYANPWQIFRRRDAGAFMVPGAPPPTLYGTLGQFDPELRVAGWF